MDSFEGPAVQKLQAASTLSEYVELMEASQLISSDAMYAKALEGLARNWRRMSLDLARRIGVDALFKVDRAGQSICHNCGVSNTLCLNPNCRFGR
jgi:hypothetical protein